MFSDGMKLLLSEVITKGDTAYVAFCPELGVVSQGRTEKSASKNLREAIELYLEDESVKEMLKEKHPQKAKISSMALAVTA